MMFPFLLVLFAIPAGPRAGHPAMSGRSGAECASSSVPPPNGPEPVNRCCALPPPTERHPTGAWPCPVTRGDGPIASPAPAEAGGGFAGVLR